MPQKDNVTTQPKKKKGHAPSHQNSEKWRHNPHSALTKTITSIEHNCLCYRCELQIEWRKDYRKYKPLKEPRRCTQCLDKSVRRAYHTICDKCAVAKGVCAKCCKPGDVNVRPKKLTEEDVLHRLEHASVKERLKRTLLRNWERGALIPHDVMEIIEIAESGKEVNWLDYKQEDGVIDEDLSDDDDARDMGVKPAKKPIAKVEDKPKVIKGNAETGVTAVTEMMEAFKI